MIPVIETNDRDQCGHDQTATFTTIPAAITVCDHDSRLFAMFPAYQLALAPCVREGRSGFGAKWLRGLQPPKKLIAVVGIRFSTIDSGVVC